MTARNAAGARVPHFLPRHLDSQLTRALQASGAVLIEGPKQSGKTTSADQASASGVRLGDDLQAQQVARSNPRLVLRGETPRLIDEWQTVPEVWNAVRAEVDDRQADGQFILTGSATPVDDVTRHSGAGRVIRLRMHPMSLHESGDSDGSVRLQDVLAGKEIYSDSKQGDARHVIDLICRGGWPANLRRTLEAAMDANRAYVENMAHVDIREAGGRTYDPGRVAALIFSLARSTAQYVTKKTMRNDAARYGQSHLGNAGDTGPSQHTLDAYLDALMRLWLAVPQEAWGESLKSPAQVRRAPKWHLADPSLAVAALRTEPEALAGSENGVYGHLFESLAFRDLSVYAQALRGSVRAWQDTRTSQEVDVVVLHEKGALWSGFEVKTSTIPRTIDMAAAGLLAVARTMETAMPPATLGVIVPTGPSYRRSDGVYVLSIQHLAP
jgi:predicted AAA+ superfamily ATPase